MAYLATRSLYHPQESDRGGWPPEISSLVPLAPDTVLSYKCKA
jgi:hypothetical protein